MVACLHISMVYFFFSYHEKCQCSICDHGRFCHSHSELRMQFPSPAPQFWLSQVTSYLISTVLSVCSVQSTFYAFPTHTAIFRDTVPMYDDSCLHDNTDIMQSCSYILHTANCFINKHSVIKLSSLRIQILISNFLFYKRNIHHSWLCHVGHLTSNPGHWPHSSPFRVPHLWRKYFEWKQPLGTTRHRQEDNIKMVLEKKGCNNAGWVHLTPDQVQWSYIHVLLKVGNMLASWVTVKFLRKILFRGDSEVTQSLIIMKGVLKLYREQLIQVESAVWPGWPLKLHSCPKTRHEPCNA
jgi:hypothetical protein